jgi:hypothetical protein
MMAKCGDPISRVLLRCPNHTESNPLAQTLRIFLARLLRLFSLKSSHRSMILDISDVILGDRVLVRLYVLCLSKISKCLKGWGLFFIHNARRCSFFS